MSDPVVYSLDGNLQANGFVALNLGLSYAENPTVDTQLEVNTGYVVDNAGAINLTLPVTAKKGAFISIQRKGAGGFSIIAATDQSIIFGNQESSGVAGVALASTATGDSIVLVCVTANTQFQVVQAVGNLTINI